MAKRYMFETYETQQAEHLDRHLEAAYNDGWFLRDNIRMINIGVTKEAQYEKSLQFAYSVTLFKIVEEADSEGPDSAAEIVTPTTGTEDEYYCIACGSRNIRVWDRYVHDEHYTARVCSDCHSDAIAIYKKY